MRKRIYMMLTLVLVFGLVLSVSSNAFAYDSYHHPIRVDLASSNSAPTVKVTSGTYYVLNSSGTVTDTVNAGSSWTLSTGCRLSSEDGNGRFQYGSYEYRGDLTYSGNFVVNTVGMEEYLYSVVMLEIGGYAPALAALEAQAVASRNFACLKIESTSNKYKDYYDLTGTTSDQVYHGYSGESDGTVVGTRVKQAVDDTRDQVMYYDGELIEAEYMANAGGYTEDVVNVWVGSDSCGYLQSVSCPWDALPFRGDAGSYESMKMPTSYEWTVTRSCTSLASALGYSGTITDVTVDHDTVTDYAKSVTVTGTSGSVTYFGAKFREKLGLRSANLDIIVGKSVTSYQPLTLQYVSSSSFSSAFSSPINTITINGRGYGHSVGMSQWSACVMASKDYGYDYKYILNYFYNQNQTNGKLTFSTYQ